LFCALGRGESAIDRRDAYSRSAPGYITVAMTAPSRSSVHYMQFLTKVEAANPGSSASS